jgi:hypothetical protein
VLLPFHHEQQVYVDGAGRLHPPEELMLLYLFSVSSRSLLMEQVDQTTRKADAPIPVLHEQQVYVDGAG